MIKVRIKTSGRYMDDNLRARNCAVDEVLETREWYGRQLIAEGLAVEAEAKPAAKPAKKSGAKSPTAQKPADPAGNPFLE